MSWYTDHCHRWTHPLPHNPLKISNMGPTTISFIWEVKTVILTITHLRWVDTPTIVTDEHSLSLTTHCKYRTWDLLQPLSSERSWQLSSPLHTWDELIHPPLPQVNLPSASQSTVNIKYETYHNFFHLRGHDSYPHNYTLEMSWYTDHCHRWTSLLPHSPL